MQLRLRHLRICAKPATEAVAGKDILITPTIAKETGQGGSQNVEVIYCN